ncbi:hypothetical protein SCHPADRAFT_898664 [Schizopora paradoxa]|uniref:Uncharacterized protein n=1 Tax=Schizopora paradoxa TaxID=27342 RepID=A0A0H2S6X2_9AGAM|nr:hypothetical protein SCHPADRAFT_898664 [Schizopora paradoxa]
MSFFDRPGFALEIIRSITNRSQVLVPLSKTRTSKYIAAKRIGPGKPIKRMWFESEPLTRETIEGLAALQLSAVCHHQSYSDFETRGNDWSYFEVAILSGLHERGEEIGEARENAREDHDDVVSLNRVKKNNAGEALSWIIFRIPTSNIAPVRFSSRLASKEFTEL